MKRFTELPKALAAIAIEKRFGSNPIAQQSYTYHIDRVAVAMNREYLLQELYWVLRVLPDLQTEQAKRYREKIDMEKLTKEVEALITIPQHMVNNVAAKIATTALRFTERAIRRLSPSPKP